MSLSRGLLAALGLVISACGTLLSLDAEEPAAVPATADAGADADADAVAPPAGDGGTEAGACGARFCCTFDEPKPCAWSGEDGKPDDVTFAIDGTHAASPPNALHATTSGAVDEATRTLFVSLGPPPPKATITLRLALEAFSGGTSSSVHPIEIVCGDDVAIAVKLKKSGALALGGGSAEDVIAASGFPLGVFFEVTLALDWNGPIVEARLASDAPGSVPVLYPQPCSGDVSVHVGGAVAGGSGAYALSFDDVRIDW
jgi:hypothetical protein